MTARRRGERLRLLLLAAAALPRLAQAQGPSRPEAAPSKTECARAFEEAQRLRNDARYLEANREVLTCTHTSCGAALSEECGKIYSELEAATPSVVFAARDSDGREVPSASVRVDEESGALGLDGKAVSLDPGKHSFVFEAEGFDPQIQSTVIRAGEKFRPIVVVLRPSRNVANAAPAAGVAAGAPGDAEPRARAPLGTYVLGGVAVVGVAGFVAFRLWGSHDFDELSRTCKPDCASSSVDAVRQKYVLSTVSLAVGAAAAAGAVTWYFAASPSAKQSTARLQVSPLPGGAAARFAASF